MISSGSPLVSVVLLTKNAQEYLAKLLTTLHAQITDFAYEIIVIDSGSGDGTQTIATANGARLVIIGSKSFNHGLTRNYALKLARGKFVAFLTQDALPKDENWLQNLIEPFFRIKNLAGVFGIHLPRPDCNPLVARDIQGHFQSLYQNREHINEAGGIEPNWERQRFFSNVNSAISKQVWQRINFPKTNYCEDQIWAELVLKAGYKTLFSPKAAVFHSHSFPFIESFRRYYDEYLGLWDAFQIAPGQSLLKCMVRSVKVSCQDIRYLIFLKKLSLLKKIYYLGYAPIFNMARQLAAYFAYRNRRNKNKWHSSLSRDKFIKES